MNEIGSDKALIPVGKEWAIVDVADYESLSRHRWLKHSKGYAYRFEKDENGVNRMKLMHREIMLPADGLVVDHINHCPLDNTRENLRVCTQGENMKNQNKMLQMNGKTTSSKFKGVYRHKNGKFKATIWCDGKQEHLKYHDTEIEAALVYDAAAREKHGEFAVLNFPNIN